MFWLGFFTGVSAKQNTPSPDVLRQLLRYEPETGKLWWKERGAEWFSSSTGRPAEHACIAWNARYANKPAFTAVNINGYLNGTFFNRTYLAHRLIWAIVYGQWPRDQIDHRDGDRTNNRIQNLREATMSENARNHSIRKDNTSGAKGVFWARREEKWAAQITTNGKHKFLGHFASKDEAIKAYASASLEFHGDFGRRTWLHPQWAAGHDPDGATGG